MAAGDNQMVMSPRQTSARSEAAQFCTWYFALYVGWTLDFIHPVWSAPSQPHSGFVHQRPVGARGILVKTGYGATQVATQPDDLSADAHAAHLLEAVGWVLDHL